MLVLHGFWTARDGLCLWAEDSGLPVSSHSQALRSARPHPFAAQASTLAAIHAGKPGEAVLLLPSLRAAPLDSPELIRVTPRPPARGKPALLPWAVPVVVLYAPSALAALPQRAPGVRYGASIGYLAGVAAFAAELVARGRVLPTLDHDGAGAVARWRPVVQGPDAVTLRALAAAMPPVCRAVPGHDDPYELVMAALAGLTDAAAREALPAGTQLIPARRGRRPARLPAAEAWLAALVGPDGRFDADAGELGTLAAALAPWEDVGTGQTGPARATFRLAEVPAGPGDELFGAGGDVDSGEAAAGGAGADGDGVHPEPAWRLEFLLQSVADPSLLVPAQQTWTDDGTLSRWLPRPQELLLAELGRASRIYPELASGLRQARPTALGLDADGAYQFLDSAAPALDEAGFGVLLPSWWNRRRKLGLTVSAHTPVDGVVDKRRQVRQGPADGLPLAARRRRRHPDRGGDRRARADQGPAGPAPRPVGGGRPRPAPARPGVPGAGTRPARPPPGRSSGWPPAIPTTWAPRSRSPGSQADGWLGELLAGAVPQMLRSVPCQLISRPTLRPYQERGLSWLAFLSSLGLGACLADDMGLGKTVQLLALEAVHRTENPGDGADAAAVPDVAGGQLAAGGREVHARPAGVRPSRSASGCATSAWRTSWRRRT